MNEIIFRINSIKTEYFNIFSYPLNEDEVMFNIKVSFVGNINQKMIDAVCFAAFFSKNIKFMEIGVLCRFEINEDSWSSLYNAANNKLKLHRGFQFEIAQTAVGITRGVLHSRTENTPYNKFYLPIIDVKDLISKESMIKENK